MTKIVTALFSAALCMPLLFAQQPQSGGTTGEPTSSQAETPAAAQASASPSADLRERIARGSVIPVQLTKTVDAKKAKPGDEVVAKVKQDIKDSAGNISVPKDTEIIGHVTDAQARSKEQKQSELVIAFDKVILKNGPTVEVPMLIQAIVAPPGNNPNASDAGGAPASPNGGMPGAAPQPDTSIGMPHTLQSAAQVPEPSSGTPQSRPAINQNTTGVVGISNLDLAAAPNGKQGSMVTSDKKNVKLESGTLMLLRVNP